MRRNWFTAFAIAVMMHASIIFAWLFLSNQPEPQTNVENAVRVSLGKWAQSLVVNSGNTITIPEVPVVQNVSPTIETAILTEYSALTEVVSEIQVQQIRDTTVDEKINVLPNQDLFSEKAKTKKSVEVSDLADSVFQISTEIRITSTGELPIRVEPEESRQPVIQQVESTRVKTPKGTVPITNKEKVPPMVKQASETIAVQSSREHLVNQEENGDDNILLQGHVNTGIDEEEFFALRAKYIRTLEAMLNAQKRYPNEAKRRGVTGVAKVRFIIRADGSSVSPELLQSTGNRHLDNEALRMFSRAEPFPPIPQSLGLNQLELQIPIVFELY